MIGDWKISDDYDEKDVAVTDVVFVSVRSNVTDFISVDGTLLIGGEIRKRAGVVIKEEKFRHEFPSSKELWLHLLDNTELGKIFVQLLFSRCDMSAIPLPIKERIPEQEKPKAGQQRRPGIVSDDITYSSSDEWYRPDSKIMCDKCYDEKSLYKIKYNKSYIYDKISKS